MRDLSKMLNLIIDNPEKDNEYILNSAGLMQGMSVDEIILENSCLSAVRRLSTDSIKGLKKVIDNRGR